jgi:hypothetical protein
MFKLVDKEADKLTEALGLTKEQFDVITKKCAELTAKDYDTKAERIVELQNEDIEILTILASKGIDMVRQSTIKEMLRGMLS